MDSARFPVLTDADGRMPLYLTSIGRWTHQEPVRRPEGYPDFQWLQVVSGEGELTIGGLRMTAKAGQGFCLFPNVPHRYEAVNGPWSLYWVSFSGTLATDMLGLGGVGESGVYAGKRPELAIFHLREMVELSQVSAYPAQGAEYSKKLYAFLLDLSRILDKTPASEFDRTRLEPVLRHIDNELHRPVTIAELAEVAGVTPQHLCTLFRKTAGIRPMEHVNRERIKRSKEMMFRESQTPIREIARRVGIDNPSYFGALFKRWEGQSPEQFKRMHGLHGQAKDGAVLAED